MAKKDFMSMLKEKTVDVRPSLLSSEENIKSQLVVLDSLRDLIPPLTEEESAQLEQNVLRHGVKDPLTIWETTATQAGIGPDETPAFVLIDGHNRYRIIRKHQLDFRINLVRFATMEEVRDYMIDYQLGRRNLTPEQASYLRGMRYNEQKIQRGSNLQTDAKAVNVAEVLATEYGVSSRTIRRDGNFAAGLERLPTDLKRAVLSGEQKLPRTAINDLTKLEPDAPQEEIVQIVLGTKPAEAPSPPVDTTPARIDKLKSEVRALTNSKLTRRDCLQLRQLLDELLAISTLK